MIFDDFVLCVFLSAMNHLSSYSILNSKFICIFGKEGEGDCVTYFFKISQPFPSIWHWSTQKLHYNNFFE